MFRIAVHVVIAHFIGYVDDDDERSGNSDAQTRDVDRGIRFISEHYPQGRLDIILDHEILNTGDIFSSAIIGPNYEAIFFLYFSAFFSGFNAISPL